MLNEKKIKSKSIRLTEPIFNYISDYPEGEGFNNKLENIVFGYVKKEEQITKEVQSKTKMLEKLNREIEEKKSIIKKLEKIEQIIEQASSIIE